MHARTDHGAHVLHEPKLNKGTAFNQEERERLGLRGLLPPRQLRQDDQVRRVLDSFRGQPTDLAKHVSLMALYGRNERLFFRLVEDNIEEMVPILYTPTVGEACKKFADIYQRARGLYVTSQDRGRIADVLGNWPESDVRVIVVTDGERILGLGDLGASGMGIPIGKLVLYTACAGIHPDQCLPVMFDVGTDNTELREDPLYLGLPQPRVQAEEYDALFEEFVAAVTTVFPRAMIQCEDFANRNARRLLDAYRDRVCMFNDDMQGTAAVALAGLYSAIRITGGSITDQRVLFVGAGTAGTGIADLIVTALIEEGLSEAAAREHCWFVDRKGLVVKGRGALKPETEKYAHAHETETDLAAMIQSVRPTALIGVTGQPGLFDVRAIRAMAAVNERPIVFPLSNPTSRAECTAEQAYTWSEGKAVVATGSPFDPVEFAGQRFVPGQGNNAHIFPGVGLGVVASGARHVTDAMFYLAAKTLAACSDPADLAQGSIYPPLTEVRKVSLAIAREVALEAYRAGLATVPEPPDLDEYISSLVYDPHY